MTYTVWTTKDDLTNNYNGITEPWEFIDSDDNGEHFEVEIDPRRATAFELLLNTDRTVITWTRDA